MLGSQKDEQSDGNPIDRMNCSPSLDHAAAEFPACSINGGPCADDRFITSIGGLLPIAL
jgi:hypothetical protein